MFSEVNSLVFLLIFLVYINLCMAVCRKMASGCHDKDTAWEMLWKGFLYSLAALILTVLTIYLWYIAILLLVLAIAYISRQCLSKGTKCILIAGIAAFIVLVAIAGIQLRMSMDADDEDDDARVEELINGKI